MKKVLIVLVVIIAGYFSAAYFLTPVEGDVEGGVTIILIDEFGNEISNETFDFESEMSLFELLNIEYDISCADSGYQADETCDFEQLGSHIILEIDELQTDWNSSYIQIFVGETASNFGIDRIMLEDNTTYVFKYVDLGGGN